MLDWVKILSWWTIYECIGVVEPSGGLSSCSRLFTLSSRCFTVSLSWAKLPLWIRVVLLLYRHHNVMCGLLRFCTSHICIVPPRAKLPFFVVVGGTRLYGKHSNNACWPKIPIIKTFIETLSYKTLYIAQHNLISFLNSSATFEHIAQIRFGKMVYPHFLS